MDFERIVVVTRKSRLRESIQRFNTVRQARFVIESRGHSFQDYELEESNYQRSRQTVMQSLPAGVKFQVIDRSYLSDFLFLPADLILVLGQDGLVVNTAKYLKSQRVIAVNPDPERFDGILLPFVPEDLPGLFALMQNRKPPERTISMAAVKVNDGQEMLAFNDFFVGPRSHTSARYTISFHEQKERQSSSGIIISTPAGSTGWLSSLWNMARGISGQQSLENVSLQWEDRRLIFAVREPFLSKWSQANIVTGEIQEEETLVVESHMAEEGVIFSDGILEDYIEFNSGATAHFSLADRRTILLTRETR
ncbi:MAG: NAD+ kinase [Spirochaetales bacterium]|nr:NAD+ kinase [Spirochaetales bacterium]